MTTKMVCSRDIMDTHQDPAKVIPVDLPWSFHYSDLPAHHQFPKACQSARHQLPPVPFLSGSPTECQLSHLGWSIHKDLFVPILFYFILLAFWDSVSLCSSGCAGTQFVDQAGLKLVDPPASAHWVLELKVCAATSRELLCLLKHMQS